MTNPPADFRQLEKTLGISFRNKDLLHEALTHRSASRGNRGKGHNERLEFLGDAVLELLATDYLFNFTDKTEGELTSWRSALVNGEHLAEVATPLKLGDYLFMSKGEEANGGRTKASTLANALEAIIGAIYLDQGFEVAQGFVNDHILVKLQELLAQGKHQDFKSAFQEKAQDLLQITPHYKTISESGPDHDKDFVCAAYLGDEKVAEGNGNSKQRAEQAAAEAGLKAKKWN